MKCAFSGHRAERFPWKSEKEQGCVFLKQQLRQEILRAIEEGYDYFLVGGATGVDTWAGEIVLELKQDGYPVALEVAVPFPAHRATLRGEWQERFDALCEGADAVVVVSTHAPMKAAYHIRNSYLVNEAQRLIVVYDNGTDWKGGTYSTLQKARKANRSVVQIEWQA